LLEKFIEAASSGRREEIVNLLADHVRVTADGGGKVSSFRKILQGSDTVARLYAGLSRKFAGRFVYRLAEINGEPGLLRYLDGKLESAQSFVINGTQICEIYIVRNPDKLNNIPM
jgi:RNA polymerase sigma-70 factor, ECF subfamily